MASMLEVKNLSKNFGDLSVLKDISFSVNKGDVIAVIGPSGSGKSTLLRCINQLEKASGGEVVVCGKTMFSTDESGKVVYAPAADLREIRLKIGLVFQNFNLFPHFSVLRNITEAPVRVLKKSREEATETARALLEKMGLESKENAYPCELSGGQQQRVSIARAMALSPEILFFDEPTSALDPELTGEILKVIRQLAAEGMTMVIVTHEMEFARDVADRVIFMEHGVIVEEGAPQQLFGSDASERTKQFLQRFNSGKEAQD